MSGLWVRGSGADCWHYSMAARSVITWLHGHVYARVVRHTGCFASHTLDARFTSAAAGPKGRRLRA
jgi:hypothetical protein